MCSNCRIFSEEYVILLLNEALIFFFSSLTFYTRLTLLKDNLGQSFHKLMLGKFVDGFEVEMVQSLVL